MIIGSVLTAEPNWHEPMLLSFCPNNYNIASATQVYLDFAIALRPWLVGKKTVGKKAPWWGSISWEARDECRRHRPGPPPPSPPKPILTCLGYRGFEPFVFEVFTTTRDWGAGQAARTSWIFCRGPCYPNPCRVVLSNSLGRTFQGCATRRPWALTPKACRSWRIRRSATPAKLITMLWEKRRPRTEQAKQRCNMLHVAWRRGVFPLQTLQRTRPRVPRASSTLSVHGWTEFTEPATPAGYAEKGQDPLQHFWVPSSIWVWCVHLCDILASGMCGFPWGHVPW